MEDKHALNRYLEIPDWLYFTLYDEHNGMIEFRIDAATGFVEFEHKDEWRLIMAPHIVTNERDEWLYAKIYNIYEQ